MKEDSMVSVSYTSFPSSAVGDKEKDTIEYGLQVGQAIQYEWFKRGGASDSRYYSRYNEFDNLRRYSRGEQSIAKYKNEIAVDGDLSYLNLDWTPVPIIPKFVDIVVNGLNERDLRPVCTAIDPLSQERKNQYQDTLEAQMVSREALSLIKEKGNINPFMLDEGDMPQTDEEMMLHMQLKYKPAIEMAEEAAIESVLKDNKYDLIRKQVDYDIVTLGMGVAKHEFLKGEGVKISYVDPANVVHSYTEDPHFSDVFYWGEFKTMPLTELFKIKPDLTPEDIKDISQASTDWYQYHGINQVDDSIYTGETCSLMYFNFKTTNKVVYKKKILDSGAMKMIEKTDEFNPPEEMLEEGRFEKVEKTIDVWYEGVMVAGTDIVIKWEMAENMVRPKSSSQHAMSMYVAVAPRIYKGSLESLVRRMIPFADLIQMTHLKLQQVISRVTPDGVYIDADGLNEIDLGNGEAYSPEEALKLYFQTGSVIGRSYTSEGEYNHGKVPIQELSHNSGANKTQMLIGNYNHYLNMIRTVTGLNEARDGSTPDPRGLVGLQKMAALNSNTATRHILDGSIYMYHMISEASSLRIADILEYASFREDFVSKVGKYNSSLLDQISGLYLYDFGIYIEIAPDEEAKQMLEQNIQMALSKGDIYLEDAIDIRDINNTKLANQLLKVKRKGKQERDEKMQMQQQAMQQQMQLQQQQMSSQVAQQKAEAETNSKVTIEQAKSQFEIAKLDKEAQLKLMLMEREFNYQMTIQGQTAQELSERENKREDKKSERISQQNSEQSELINQRQTKGAPLKFESNEDSLDGFHLGEFDPR